MTRGKVLRVRIPEELYWLLLREAGSPKKLSETVAGLLEKALNLQGSKFSSLQALEPSSHQVSEPSRLQVSEVSSRETSKAQPQPAETEQDRPATPAQVETIWNIAWEIASWSDVKDVVSKLVGFPVPDDPSQLTISQASRVIEVLGKLNRRLHPRQAKTVQRLLGKLAERENLKPEEVADKYNVPLETSKLKRYHLELLKMLVGETK
jgi:hypothetical protein